MLQITASTRLIPLALAAATTIWPLLVANGQDLTICDNFDDGVVDPALWSIGEVGTATVIETVGSLEMSAAAGSAGTAQVTTNVVFVGDFDVYVDFELIQFPAADRAHTSLRATAVPDSPLNQLALKRVRNSQFDGYGIIKYTDDVPESFQFAADDSSGRLRITRVGDLFSAFVWDGDWVLLHTTTHFAGPVQFSLDAFNTIDYPGVAVQYDDFCASADDATGDDCNGNGTPDWQDIFDCDGSPWCSDVNQNSVPDGCEGDPPAYFESCEHIRLFFGGDVSDGVYEISPDGQASLDVYCDMKPDRGWTIIDPSRDPDWSQFFSHWQPFAGGLVYGIPDSCASWRDWFLLSTPTTRFAACEDGMQISMPDRVYRMTGNYYGCRWLNPNCNFDGTCHECWDNYGGWAHGTCPWLGLVGPDFTYCYSCPLDSWNSAPSIGADGTHCVAYCPDLTDCNGNGLPDEDDIASGFSTDINNNGIPDECEGPTYAEQLWATVDNTDADLGPVGEYELWVQSTEPLTDLTGRPLAEATDVAPLESIYAIDPDTQVVTDRGLVETLVVLAQSARKVPNVNVGDREFLIDGGDLHDGGRQLGIWPLLDGPVVQAPNAVPGWWFHTFVSEGYVIFPIYWTTGAMWDGHREEMYAEVILDAILQPDLADELKDDMRLRARLGRMLELGGDAVPENVKQAVMERRDGQAVILANQFESLMDVLSAVTEGSAASTLFAGWTGVFAVTNQIGEVYGDFVRSALLKALADGEAECRLQAIEWAIDRIPQEELDPALIDGVQLARVQWNALLDDWYAPQGRMAQLAEAAADVGFLDWGVFSAQMVSVGAGIMGVQIAGVSLSHVILPYTLSWSVNGSIRDQSYAAQRCCLAATLQRELYRPEVMPALPDEFYLQDPIDGDSARNAAHLMQVNAYLGHYFYDRYLKISNNTMTSLWGNALEFLSLGALPYGDFIDNLEARLEEAQDEAELLRAPQLLTTNADPFDPAATDDEYSWLMSRVVTAPLIPDDPNQNPVLDATFSWSPIPALRGEPVTFTPTMTGLASYLWEFGDGTTSDEESPTHTFDSFGAFTVSLTVTDVRSAPKTHAIGVTVSEPPPVADFVVDTPQILAGETASFTNVSSGTITGYLWSFGDGGMSTATNPMHWYGNPGNYVVTLTAYGPGGQNSHVVEAAVQVSGDIGTVDVTTDLPEGSFQVSGPNGMVISGSGVSNSYANQPAGEYTITWNPRQGYETPASETLTLAAGQNIVFSSSYVELPEPDTTPPTVTQTVPAEGAYVASMDEIMITFSEQVRVSPANVVIEDQDGVGYVADTFDVSPGAGGETVVTLTYDTSPPHGEYLIRVRDVVLDMQNNALDGDGDGQPGGDFELHIYRLAGDLDANGLVDAADFARFAVCLNGPDITTPPPGADPIDFINADLDYDFDVDIEDFAQLQASFGLGS